MAPLSSYTLVALARRLAREIGAIRAEGTAASATGTVVTDTVNLVTFPANDDAIGYEFVIISGGGTDNEGVSRWITDSVGSATYTITVPSVSNMNSTTPVYMVLDPRIATYQQLVDAIRAAIESVLHLSLAVKMNATLRVNDLMMGLGDMEVWTNGASSASDGWTLAGTGAAVARASGVGITDAPHDGADFEVQYSAGLTNSASEALTYTWRPDFQKFWAYNGKAFEFLARVVVGTASRVRLDLNDGVASAYSDYHTGGGNFEEFSKQVTLGNPVTDLAAIMRIESGAQITCRVDSTRLLSKSFNLYDYTLPANFTALSEVWMGGEDELEFTFDRRVPDHLWDVVKGASNDRLRFRPGLFLPEDCRILLIGQTDITIPSAATNNITANPEYVLSFAKSQIYYRNGKIAEGDRWYAISQRQRDDLASALLPNSKVIERL